jgi:hypothetical protein
MVASNGRLRRGSPEVEEGLQGSHIPFVFLSVMKFIEFTTQ